MKHTREQLNSIKALMVANQNKEDFNIRSPVYHGFAGATREDIFFVLDNAINGLSINFKDNKILFEEVGDKVYAKYYSIIPVDREHNPCNEDECYDYDYILTSAQEIN